MTQKNNQDEKTKKNVELIFQLYKENYYAQIDEWNYIEQKIKVTLAIYSILLVVFYNVSVSSLFISIYLCLWFIFLLIGVLLLILSLRMRSIKKLKDSIEMSIDDSDPLVNMLVIKRDLEIIINKNKLAITKKSEPLYLSVNYFLPANLLFASVALIQKVWSFYS